jgi:hypothetical protein
MKSSKSRTVPIASAPCSSSYGSTCDSITRRRRLASRNEHAGYIYIAYIYIAYIYIYIACVILYIWRLQDRQQRASQECTWCLQEHSCASIAVQALPRFVAHVLKTAGWQSVRCENCADHLLLRSQRCYCQLLQLEFMLLRERW